MDNPGIQRSSATRRIINSMGFGISIKSALIEKFDHITISYDFQILGFDSLEFIPLLAIIILSFRKESLMQVNTYENTETILSDLSSIKILPLIQFALSSRD